MNTTADSNLTKRALAAAMKELMEQMPFSKISVSDIAEQCGMNRKSFYYHFKDKYDLVNWIFDMEYLQLSSRQDYAGIWDFLTELCSFFYENRSFYRRALRIEGQNSFLEHFKEVLEPSIKYFWRPRWRKRNTSSSASIFMRMPLLRRLCGGFPIKIVYRRRNLCGC